MPFLRIISNAELRDKNPERCVESAAEFLSELTGKPINSIVVEVKTGEIMCFEGSSQTKGILAYIEAIGFADKEKLARLLTEFLYDKFEDVELSTINIVLRDMSPAEVIKSGKLLG